MNIFLCLEKKSCQSYWSSWDFQGLLTWAEPDERSVFVVLFPEEKQTRCFLPFFSRACLSRGGAHHFVSAGTWLWKWKWGLENLLFRLMFTIPWHSQSVAGVHFFSGFTHAGCAQIEKGKEIGRQFWMWEWEWYWLLYWCASWVGGVPDDTIE